MVPDGDGVCCGGRCMVSGCCLGWDWEALLRHTMLAKAVLQVVGCLRVVCHCKL